MAKFGEPVTSRLKTISLERARQIGGRFKSGISPRQRQQAETISQQQQYAQTEREKQIAEYEAQKSEYESQIASVEKERAEWKLAQDIADQMDRGSPVAMWTLPGGVADKVRQIQEGEQASARAGFLDAQLKDMQQAQQVQPAYYNQQTGEVIYKSISPEIVKEKGYVPLEVVGKTEAGENIFRSEYGLLTGEQEVRRKALSTFYKTTPSLFTFSDILQEPPKEFIIPSTPPQKEFVSIDKEVNDAFVGKYVYTGETIPTQTILGRVTQRIGEVKRGATDILQMAILDMPQPIQLPYSKQIREYTYASLMGLGGYTGKQLTPITGAIKVRGKEYYVFDPFIPFKALSKGIASGENVPYIGSYLSVASEFIPKNIVEYTLFKGFLKAYQYAPKLISGAITLKGLYEEFTAKTPKERAMANIDIVLGGLGLWGSFGYKGVKPRTRYELPGELKAEKFIRSRKRPSLIIEEETGRVLFELSRDTKLGILPGGKLELGETAMKAIKRETLEELFGLTKKQLGSLSEKEMTKLLSERGIGEIVPSKPIRFGREEFLMFKTKVKDLEKLPYKLQKKEIAGLEFIKPKVYKGRTYKEIFGHKQLFDKAIRVEDLYAVSRTKALEKFDLLSFIEKSKYLKRGSEFIRREFGLTRFREFAKQYGAEDITREGFLFERDLNLRSLIIPERQQKGFISPGKAFRLESFKVGGKIKFPTRIEKFSWKEPSTYMDAFLGRKAGRFKKFYKLGEPDIRVEFASGYDINVQRLLGLKGKVKTYISGQREPFLTEEQLGLLGIKKRGKTFDLSDKRIRQILNEVMMKEKILPKELPKPQFKKMKIFGEYFPDTREIIIRKGLGKQDTMETYLHELTHHKWATLIKKDITEGLYKKYKVSPKQVRKLLQKKLPKEFGILDIKSYKKMKPYELAEESLAFSAEYFTKLSSKKLPKILKKIKERPEIERRVRGFLAEFLYKELKIPTKELIEKYYKYGFKREIPTGTMKPTLKSSLGKQFEVRPLAQRGVGGFKGMFFQPPTSKGLFGEAYLGASYLGIFKGAESYEAGITFFRPKPIYYKYKGKAGEDLIFTKKALLGIEAEVGTEPSKVFKLFKSRRVNLEKQKVIEQELQLVKTKRGQLSEQDIQNQLMNMDKLSSKERELFISRVKKETGRDLFKSQKVYISPREKLTELSLASIKLSKFKKSDEERLNIKKSELKAFGFEKEKYKPIKEKYTYTFPEDRYLMPVEKIKPITYDYTFPKEKIKPYAYKEITEIKQLPYKPYKYTQRKMPTKFTFKQPKIFKMPKLPKPKRVKDIFYSPSFTAKELGITKKISMKQLKQQAKFGFSAADIREVISL